MPYFFRKYLWISVGIHLLALILIIFSPEFSRLLPEKKTKVTWVQLTKGTGNKPSKTPFKKAKGMPASTIREQKEALKEIAKDEKGKDKKSLKSPLQKMIEEKKKVSKKKVAEKGGIDLSKKKKGRKRTIDDALARVQEQLEKRKVEIEAAQIEEEGEGQSPYGSLSIQKGETDPILVAYYEKVKRKINKEWITTPKSLEEGQVFRTKITVMIDSGGRIVSTQYSRKSGDNSFDLSAMRAIERAAPFPIPPPSIKKEAIREGFLIEFSPRTVVGAW